MATPRPLADQARPQRAHAPMTTAEAGRLGGRATRRRYGLEHYRLIGARGGQRLAEPVRGAERAERQAQRRSRG